MKTLLSMNNAMQFATAYCRPAPILSECLLPLLLPGITFLIFNLSFLIPSSAQVFNSTGGKMYVAGGAMTMKGKMILDTATVIENRGVIKTDSLRNSGDIRLTGTASQLVIDSGIVLEDGVVELNSNKLVLLNSDTGALQVTEGKLIAEDSLWGKVVWHIGEDTGKIVIPFYTDSLENISIEVEVLQAGEGTSGYLEFSTYQTSVDNNPKPIDLQNYPFAVQNIDSHFLKIVNRYWNYKVVGYTFNPIITMTIRYTDSEIEEDSIAESGLMASVLQDLCWGHWKQVAGLMDTSENKFQIDSLKDNALVILHDTVTWNICKGTVARNTFRSMMNAEDPNYYSIVDSIDEILEILEQAEKSGLEVFEEEGFREAYPKWRYYWAERVGQKGTNPGSFELAFDALTSGNINLPSDCIPFSTTPLWRFEGPDVDPLDASCPTGRVQNTGFVSQVWVDPDDHEHATNNPDHIIVSIPTSGLWEINDGLQWRNISQGANGNSPLLNYQIRSFAVQPDHPNIIFVATDMYDFNDNTFMFTGMYYTTDGGDTWYKDNTFDLLDILEMSAFDASYPLISYAKVQKIKFSPPPYEKYLYAIGQRHVFRKDITNLANPWEVISDLSVGSKDLVYHDIEFDRDDPDNVFVCLDDEVPWTPASEGQLFFSNNAGASNSTWTAVGNNFPNATGGTITDYFVVKVSIPNDGSGKVYALLYDGDNGGQLGLTGSNNFAIYEADLADFPNNHTWILKGQGLFPPVGAVGQINMSFIVSNSRSSTTNNPIIYLPIDIFFFTDDFGTTLYGDNENGAFNATYTDCNRHADLRDMQLVESNVATDDGVDDLIYLGTDGGISMHPEGINLCDVYTTTNTNSCFVNLNQTGLGGQHLTDFDIDPLDPDYFVYSAIHHHMTHRLRNGAVVDWERFGCGDTYQANVIYVNGVRTILWSAGSGGPTSNLSFGTSCFSSNVTTNGLYQGRSLLHKPVQVHPNGNIYLGGHNLMISSATIPLDFNNISSGTNANHNGYDDIFNPPCFVTSTCPTSETGLEDLKQIAATHEGLPAGIGGFNVNESNNQVIYVHFKGRSWANPMGIIKTENGGQTWTNLTSVFTNQNYVPWGGPYDLFAVTDIKSDPNNSDKAWISFAGFPFDENTGEFRPRLDRVWRTCGEDHWEDASTGLPEVPVLKLAIFKYSDKDVVFAATTMGVYMYVQDEEEPCSGHWECISNGLPLIEVRDLEIDYCKMRLYAGTYGWGIWSWQIPDELIELENENLIINQNTEWNGETRWIDGNIIVESGNILEVTNGSAVNMPRTGKIIVERGAKLIVDGSTITNACEEMWHGIEVLGNAQRSLSIFGTGFLTYPHPPLSSVYDFSTSTDGSYPSSELHSGVLVLNNATIENARHAIRSGKDSPTFEPAYAGGIIVAENSTFLNNGFCVEIPKYNYKPTDPTGLFYFKGCTFRTDGLLNTSGVYPTAFVQMWAVRGARFIENTFVNETPELYSNATLGIGIRSWDATFNVIEGTNCDAYTQTGCANYTANTFENLYYGIWKEDAIAAGRTNIRYNSFINNEVGILLKGAGITNILKNDFTVPDVFPGAGIIVNGGNNFTMQENVFNLPDASSTHFGVYITKTGEVTNEPYSNIFHGGENNYALAAEGINRKLTFKCNKVEDEMDNIVVLRLNSQGNPEIDENQGICPLIDNDLAPALPANNKFASDCDATFTHIWVHPDTEPFHYRFRDGVTREEPEDDCMNSLQISRKDPCPDVSADGGCLSKIDDVEDGIDDGTGKVSGLKASVNRLYSNFDHGSTQALVSMAKNMATPDTTLMDTLFAANGWASDDVLLATMHRDPLPDSAVLSSLLLDNAPHTRRVFSRILELKEWMPADSVDLMEELQDTTSPRLDSMQLIYTYQQLKGTTYAEMLYYAELDTNLTLQSIIDSLETESDLNSRLLLGELYMNTGEYGKADTLFNDLPQYDDELNEYKKLMNILTDVLGDGYYFDTIGGTGYDYAEDLEEIALTNTAAGARAQVILSIISDSVYTMEFAYKEGTPKMSSGESDDDNKAMQNDTMVTIDYKIYPSLINGVEVGRLMLKENETGFLNIYTVQGKPILEVSLSEGMNYIPFSGLTSGVLLYKVWVNGEMKRGDKLVKVQ